MTNDNERVFRRLNHIAEAIRQIEKLLAGKSFADIESDRAVGAAFERFIEIISEASRHIPAAMQDEAPQVPWVRLRTIGNVIRHTYDKVDARTLWNIYASGDLSALFGVVEGLIERLRPMLEDYLD